MSSSTTPEADTQPATDRPHQAHDAKQGNDGPRWTEIVQAAAAVAGVVGLIWGLAVGIQTLNASIEDTRLDQRAWIGTTEYSVQIEVGKPLVAVVTLKNFGRTPAINLSGKAVFEPTSKGRTPSFNYAHDPTIQVPVMLPNADHMASHVVTRSIQDPQVIRPLNQPLFDQLMRGDIKLIAHGRIDYEDIFGGKHWTEWAAVFNTDNHTWSSLPVHNSIDTKAQPR